MRNTSDNAGAQAPRFPDPTSTVDEVIGEFTEKEFGNYFHYTVNDGYEPNPKLRPCGALINSWPTEFFYPHKIWVGGPAGTNGWRYGTVKKTVAYIVVDEDRYGRPVTEKWLLKKNIVFQDMAVEDYA